MKAPKVNARLAKLVLALKKAKQAHALVSKKEEALRAVKAKCEEKVLAELNKMKLDKVSAAGLTVSTGRVDIVENINWPVLYQYIARNKAFELLQRRVSVSAVVERHEAGKQVAGVKLGHLKRLYVTKSGRSI